MDDKYLEFEKFGETRGGGSGDGSSSGEKLRLVGLEKFSFAALLRRVSLFFCYCWSCIMYSLKISDYYFVKFFIIYGVLYSCSIDY